MSFTHINAEGKANMVDVSDKAETRREAKAEAFIYMATETLTLVTENSLKGDVLSVARIAGIQAAKQCSQLVPALSSTDAKFYWRRVYTRA